MKPAPRPIQLLVLQQRRPEVPAEAFQAFRSGALASRLRAWPACRRYVQYDVRPGTPQLRFPPPLDLCVDAIDEIWLAAGADDAGAVVDELWSGLASTALQSFVASMKVCQCEEREVKRAGLQEGDAGQGLLKRLVPLARKAGTTHEQFMVHWTTVHAPLLLAVRPGPLRYGQLAVLRELEPPPGIPRMAAEIDGFSESWFADERQMNAAVDTPEGRALAADNALYVERSRRIFFDERTIVPAP